MNSQQLLLLEQQQIIEQLGKLLVVDFLLVEQLISKAHFRRSHIQLHR
jgi:hypothetical protein